MSMTGASDSSDPTMSEINVTPLVDVMLVLLIIFMITAPLMQQGVEVDLPKTHAQVIEQKDKQPLELRIDKEQNIFIGKTPVTREELEEKLKFNERLQREKKMDLAADRTLPYGFVVDVMATIRSDAAVTVEHRLDLNFVYLPGSPLSEQIATTHPHFATLLDTVSAYLAPTGIQLGESLLDLLE